MEAKLVWVTPNAEALMAYCARVSSPNQENPEYAGLLSYCLKHSHWSVFEMASACLEVTTSRAIAQQIIRHKTFHIQEFSQRYAEATTVETYPARRQDKKNRQSSHDDLSPEVKTWFVSEQERLWSAAKVSYDQALSKGVAKECARFLLPLATTTRLYLAAPVRTWIHYIRVRAAQETQLEHREVARACATILAKEFPTVAGIEGWGKYD